MRKKPPVKADEPTNNCGQQRAGNEETGRPHNLKSGANSTAISQKLTRRKNIDSTVCGMVTSFFIPSEIGTFVTVTQLAGGRCGFCCKAYPVAEAGHETTLWLLDPVMVSAGAL